MKLFLVLILATALNQIMAARTGAPLRTTTSLSGSKANRTVYSHPASSIPSIIYEMMDNSTGLGDNRFSSGPVYGVETQATASEYALDTPYQGEKHRYGKDYTYVEAIVESFSQAGIGGYPLEVASMVGNHIRINSDYV